LSQVGKYPAVANETIEERVARIRSTVENIVAKVGEHPEYELKRQWLRDKPPLKAEFIRDVLSIVNSEIPDGRDRLLAAATMNSMMLSSGNFSMLTWTRRRFLK
jgi:hypothetical protein